MAFDAETLKHMAARAVSEYLNSGKLLNKAIADIAVEEKLNPEQISRLVETTNKVAYLKIMETATDRTMTFPLASVEDVNSEILGVSPAPMQKAASATVRSPLDIVAGIRAVEMEKAAQEFDAPYQPSREEVESNLHKVASYFRKENERIYMAKEQVAHDLIKLAREISKDPQAAEKITLTTSAPAELCKMAGVEPFQGEMVRPFYDREVALVKQFDGLWKQAHELIEQEKSLKTQLEKFASYGTLMANVANPLEKSAVVASAAGAAQASKPLIGGLIGYLGRGKSLSDKAMGVFRAADTYGQASLIDKGPSAWQQLRG